MVQRLLRTVLILIALIKIVRGAPLKKVSFENGDAEEDADRKLEMKRLDDFLDWYYESYVNPQKWHKIDHKSSENDVKKTNNVDAYEKMQSDQPAVKNYALDKDDDLQTFQDLEPLSSFYANLTSMVNLTKYSEENNNFTDIEYIRTMRNRTKDNWIQMLKDNILRQVGRVNSTMAKPGDKFENLGLNISILMPSLTIPNDSIDDEFVTEKIRSYYPSCEIPRNTDQELWKEENAMNLYFNVDHGPEENGVTIATATLRLYRLPQGNFTLSGVDTSCENTSGAEEEKLLRVSIYWYTKSLKRNRVKRRLSDSKVVGENSKWVELSVRPATKAWVKGKNLGLAVLVEDQDGTLLKADKYFKGASCTVGTSTPKPIPTVIVDATRWANELERGNGNAGRNSTAALYNHISLLPTIDICTLEFPQNYSNMSLTNLRINACDLKKTHDQNRMSQEKENLEKFAALAAVVPNTHHIRHQRQHLQEMNMDPRSRIVGQQIVLTNQELLNYNAQLANNRSFTNINR